MTTMIYSKKLNNAELATLHFLKRNYPSLIKDVVAFRPTHKYIRDNLKRSYNRIYAIIGQLWARCMEKQDMEQFHAIGAIQEDTNNYLETLYEKFAHQYIFNPSAPLYKIYEKAIYESELWSIEDAITKCQNEGSTYGPFSFSWELTNKGIGYWGKIYSAYKKLQPITQDMVLQKNEE